MDSEKTTKPSGGGDYAAYLPLINVAEGLRRVMNSKKLYFNLLTRFDIRKTVNELVSSINAADFSAITNNAHTIKGVAANLSLNELKNVSEIIETRAKNGEECADMIEPLEETADKTIKLIEELLKNEV